MGDRGQQEIRERVWVEKFDHSGDEPVLVETVFVERTRQLPGSVTDACTAKRCEACVGVAATGERCLCACHREQP